MLLAPRRLEQLQTIGTDQHTPSKARQTIERTMLTCTTCCRRANAALNLLRSVSFRTEAASSLTRTIPFFLNSGVALGKSLKSSVACACSDSQVRTVCAKSVR